MTIARLPLALLPLLLVAAAPSSVPRFDFEKTCRGRATQDVGAGGSDACLKDERGAREELQRGWAKVPADVRERCVGEVQIGGSPSYVELLVCTQMSSWSKEPPNPATTGPAPAAAPARRRP